MQDKSLFRRGFKTKADNWSVEYRAKLFQQACSPLDAFKLAGHMNVHIYPASEILTSPDDLAQLAGKDGFDDCGWSALTMDTVAGNTIIIHNHNHSDVRQQSNIMHELAHILCEH